MRLLPCARARRNAFDYRPDCSVFSAEELAGGWRLACQAHAETPLVLECGQWRMDILTDNSSLSGAGKIGLGIAIDLGTTTIAAQMIDLATGNVLGVETALNPQALFGSDVMSRVRHGFAGSRSNYGGARCSAADDHQLDPAAAKKRLSR